MLPSFCKEHPQAQILHEWNRTVFTVRGGESGSPLDGGHQYFCAVCHTELCSPEEFENRQKSAQHRVHPTAFGVCPHGVNLGNQVCSACEPEKFGVG